MKNILFTGLSLLVVLLASCEREDILEPSGNDSDRVAGNIDLSIPEVSRWYDDYNMGVLYEYDTIMDFAYVAGSEEEADYWASVEIPEMRTLFADTLGVMAAENEEPYREYVQGAMSFLDTTLFRYFDPNGKVASMMPFKVLVSESVYSERSIKGEASNVLTESYDRIGYSGRYGQRTIYNNHSIVFSYDQDDVERNLEEYRRDNFYILVSRIFGMHDLYSELPEEFYAGKSDYYGRNMEDAIREDLGIDEENRVDYIDKDWFYSKGFVPSEYFYATFGLRNVYQYYDYEGNELPSRVIHPDGLRPNYDFVSDYQKDVRAYICEMIFKTEADFEAYPENIKSNFRALLSLFEDLGVDIIAMNPDLEVLNQ